MFQLSEPSFPREFRHPCLTADGEFFGMSRTSHPRSPDAKKESSLNFVLAVFFEGTKSQLPNDSYPKMYRLTQLL